MAPVCRRSGTEAAPRVRGRMATTDWNPILRAELEQPYFRALRSFVDDERRRHEVFPAAEDVFAALHLTPYAEVKVVILGQDPYHGAGQAHGLCFSVPPGVPVPPSLQNIYKELASDVGVAPPDHGCLSPWARRGVLLLNAVLTVEEGRPGAHRGKGWEGFTDQVIQALAAEREHLVFMLWGSYAQAKGKVIDPARHRLLKAPHPSPLSAHRGFLGCRHFSQANQYLERHGLGAVDWTLPRRAQLEA